MNPDAPSSTTPHRQYRALAMLSAWTLAAVMSTPGRTTGSERGAAGVRPAAGEAGAVAEAAKTPKTALSRARQTTPLTPPTALATQDPRFGIVVLAIGSDLIYADGFELGLCGSPWSGWSGGDTAAKADCANCPTTVGLQAAITKQIEHEDDESCTVDVEIVTLTVSPVKLAAQSVDVPQDVIVDSLQTTGCSAASGGANFLCRHFMVFDYTESISFNGDYDLHLQLQCTPAMTQCFLCSGAVERVVSFSLTGTACDVAELEPGEVQGNVWADTDGDGTRDPGELSLPTASGVIVQIYADANANGLPDGAALATSPTDENGDYGFGGLDGTYVLRALLAGRCPSSGPDSQFDLDTGYTPPITVEVAFPPVVVSGVDLGLTQVCP